MNDLVTLKPVPSTVEGATWYKRIRNHRAGDVGQSQLCAISSTIRSWNTLAGIPGSGRDARKIVT